MTVSQLIVFQSALKQGNGVDALLTVCSLDAFQRRKTRSELPNNKKEVKELPGKHHQATRERGAEREMPPLKQDEMCA